MCKSTSWNGALEVKQELADMGVLCAIESDVESEPEQGDLFDDISATKTRLTDELSRIERELAVVDRLMKKRKA